jgi:hypothetical protein
MCSRQICSGDKMQKNSLGNRMHVTAAGGFQDWQQPISMFQFWGHCQSLDSLWHLFASLLVCYGVFSAKPPLLGLARIFLYISSPPIPFSVRILVAVISMPFLVFRKEPVLNGPHLNPVACTVLVMCSMVCHLSGCSIISLDLAL